MNKKNILPLIAVMAILPVIAMVSFSESSFNESSMTKSYTDTDKELQIISSSERNFTIPELYDTADLVIEGKILNTMPFEKLVDKEHKKPWLFTIATVQIQEVLKGEVTSKAIRVQLLGGETEDKIAISERLDVQKSDVVIMFLELDPENIYGSNYNLIAPTQSLFQIHDGNAFKYEEERTIPVEAFKNALKTKIGLN